MSGSGTPKKREELPPPAEREIDFQFEPRATSDAEIIEMAITETLHADNRGRSPMN